MPVEGGTEYAVVPIVKDGTVSMLVTDPNTGHVRHRHQRRLHRRAGRRRPADRRQGHRGQRLRHPEPRHPDLEPRLQRQWNALQPPLDEATGTYLRPISITKATEAQAGYVYDANQDAMVITATGDVYPADGDIGNFKSATTARC